MKTDSIKQCYLCRSQTEFFLRKNGYNIYRCPSCGLGITDLRKDYEQFVRQNYRKGYFTGEPEYSAYANYEKDKPYIVRNMRKFLSKIRRYKPGGKLLDVGCAMGFFVELALQNGYDAYGFDPSEYAVREARKIADGRIRHATVKTVKYEPKSFDVITLFDVFEHLGDPAADLRRLHTFLKDDGILIIATGDSKSTAAQILRRRWTFYIPPQHLFFFDRKTITTLLNQEGFAPFEWFRIGKWLSLEYVLHLARTTGESRIAKMLYRVAKKTKTERAPLYIPMGDNMVVIARKASYLNALNS